MARAPDARKRRESRVKGIAESQNQNGLNDKQELFCIYYIKLHNAVKAYQKAYGTTYKSAARCAYRLLNNPDIVAELKTLRAEQLDSVTLDVNDIVQKYIDIAFADMTDYVEFEGDEIKFKPSDSVDGTLITEVSTGRIKLADRMKALEFLAAYVGILTPEQKAKLELIKAQSDKLAREDGSAEEAADDGFLKALEGTAAEDWTDEKS